MTLTAKQVKDYAKYIGFSKVGIAPIQDFHEFTEELASRGEEYGFFINGPYDPINKGNLTKCHLDAKSIVVVAWDYAQLGFSRNLLDKIGRIYQARCYTPHDGTLAKARLNLMDSFLRKNGCKIIDSFVPERWAAAKAGIASFGRNTFAYADGIGSFIVISAFLINQELEYDTPMMRCKCPPGCTKCIDACPTNALYQPFRLNPRQCIAFNAWLTISERGISEIIPKQIRSKMEQRVHGCDLCQTACPRNQVKLNEQLPPDAFLREYEKEDLLVNMLHMRDGYYESRIRPIMYNYIRKNYIFQRNAAIALGNTQNPAYLDDLAEEMNHEIDVVRAHVAWAIGCIGGNRAEEILQNHRKKETIPYVVQEIEDALKAIQAGKRS